MSKSKKHIKNSKSSSQLVTTHKGSQHNKEGSKSIYYSLNAIERCCAIYNVIIASVKNALNDNFLESKKRSSKFFLEAKFHLKNINKIEEVNLDGCMDKENYYRQASCHCNP